MAVAAAWHRKALAISSTLTRSFHEMRGTRSVSVTPQKVIRVLRAAGVRFVVMGTHGIAGYRSEPRATQGVDVLVRKRDHARAGAALRAAFSTLGVIDGVAVTRFLDLKTKRVVIDFMKPEFNLYRLTFRNTVTVNDAYRIPNLEMALVAKFVAMTAANRAEDKRHVDVGDFVNVVRHNRHELNLPRLRRLADGVRGNGGREILRLIEDIDAGRRISI